MAFKHYIFISIILIFLLFSTNISASDNWTCGSSNENLGQKIKCIVIDPGHGGKDPGAINSASKITEKSITLSVALKLGNLIKAKYPNIKVIYTRSSDKYVDLYSRANIANKNKADLFLSIHCNAAKSTTANGTETFVMGSSKSAGNFEVCKLENSVITIEDDYKTKYEGFDPNSPESYIIFSLLQNTHLEQSLIFASDIQNSFENGPIKYNRGVKQGGLLVLWKTTMPAVLTEIGFISSPKDRGILSNSNRQKDIAECLFAAFTEYKNKYEVKVPYIKNTNDTISNKEIKKETKTDIKQEKPEEENKAEEVSSEAITWGIQIMNINKIISCSSSIFKGFKVKRYQDKETYKYIYGNYTNREDAIKKLPEIRKHFKDAFIIQVENKLLEK